MCVCVCDDNVVWKISAQNSQLTYEGRINVERTERYKNSLQNSGIGSI